MSDVAVQVGSVLLKNPVLTASGCFGYGLEYDDFYDVASLGGICTKGLSRLPRLGNPPDRICETPAGMLNAIGLANVGVEVFCTEKLPRLRQRGVTVIANIFASSVEDFVAIAERLDVEEGVTAIELNVSCPNVKEGGIEFGKDARMCGRVTDAVRRATKLPLWVKMSPEAGNIIEVARACETAGAEAVTAINTIRGTSVDLERKRLRLANATGGLSGPALKPIALRVVWELSQTLSIPVIGIGGIATTRDAIEFLMAGATAVQIGTANFADPRAAEHVRLGIAEYVSSHGITAQSLVGVLRR